MNTQASSLKMILSKEELKKMASQVEETIAKEYTDQKKGFGTLDLWNIQRRKRNVHLRRTSLQ